MALYGSGGLGGGGLTLGGLGVGGLGGRGFYNPAAGLNAVTAEDLLYLQELMRQQEEELAKAREGGGDGGILGAIRGFGGTINDLVEGGVSKTGLDKIPYVSRAAGQIAEGLIWGIPGTMLMGPTIAKQSLQDTFGDVSGDPASWLEAAASLALAPGTAGAGPGIIDELQGQDSALLRGAYGEMAGTIAEDFRHPLRNIGYLTLDIAGAATLGRSGLGRIRTGLQRRQGAAGRGPLVPPGDRLSPTPLATEAPQPLREVPVQEAAEIARVENERMRMESEQQAAIDNQRLAAQMLEQEVGVPGALPSLEQIGAAVEGAGGIQPWLAEVQQAAVGTRPLDAEAWRRFLTQPLSKVDPLEVLRWREPMGFRPPMRTGIPEYGQTERINLGRGGPGEAAVLEPPPGGPPSPIGIDFGAMEEAAQRRPPSQFEEQVFTEEPPPQAGGPMDIDLSGIEERAAAQPGLDLEQVLQGLEDMLPPPEGPRTPLEYATDLVTGRIGTQQIQASGGGPDVLWDVIKMIQNEEARAMGRPLVARQLPDFTDPNLSAEGLLKRQEARHEELKGIYASEEATRVNNMLHQLGAHLVDPATMNRMATRPRHSEETFRPRRREGTSPADEDYVLHRGGEPTDYGWKLTSYGPGGEARPGVILGPGEGVEQRYRVTEKGTPLGPPITDTRTAFELARTYASESMAGLPKAFRELERGSGRIVKLGEKWAAKEGEEYVTLERAKELAGEHYQERSAAERARKGAGKRADKLLDSEEQAWVDEVMAAAPEEIVAEASVKGKFTRPILLQRVADLGEEAVPWVDEAGKTRIVEMANRATDVKLSEIEMPVEEQIAGRLTPEQQAERERYLKETEGGVPEEMPIADIRLAEVTAAELERSLGRTEKVGALAEDLADRDTILGIKVPKSAMSEDDWQAMRDQAPVEVHPFLDALEQAMGQAAPEQLSQLRGARQLAQIRSELLFSSDAPRMRRQVRQEIREGKQPFIGDEQDFLRQQGRAMRSKKKILEELSENEAIYGKLISDLASHARYGKAKYGALNPNVPDHPRDAFNKLLDELERGSQEGRTEAMAGFESPSGVPGSEAAIAAVEEAAAGLFRVGPVGKILRQERQPRVKREEPVPREERVTPEPVDEAAAQVAEARAEIEYLQPELKKTERVWDEIQLVEEEKLPTNNAKLLKQAENLEDMDIQNAVEEYRVLSRKDFERGEDGAIEYYEAKAEAFDDLRVAVDDYFARLQEELMDMETLVEREPPPAPRAAEPVERLGAEETTQIEKRSGEQPKRQTKRRGEGEQALGRSVRLANVREVAPSMPETEARSAAKQIRNELDRRQAAGEAVNEDAVRQAGVAAGLDAETAAALADAAVNAPEITVKLRKGSFAKLLETSGLSDEHIANLGEDLKELRAEHKEAGTSPTKTDYRRVLDDLDPIYGEGTGDRVFNFLYEVEGGPNKIASILLPILAGLGMGDITGGTSAAFIGMAGRMRGERPVSPRSGPPSFGHLAREFLRGATGPQPGPGVTTFTRLTEEGRRVQVADQPLTGSIYEPVQRWYHRWLQEAADDVQRATFDDSQAGRWNRLGNKLWEHKVERYSNMRERMMSPARLLTSQLMWQAEIERMSDVIEAMNLPPEERYRLAEKAASEFGESPMEREAVRRGMTPEVGWLGKTMDTANQIAALQLLYLKPGYIPPNFLGQLLFTTINHAWNPFSMSRSYKVVQDLRANYPEFDNMAQELAQAGPVEILQTERGWSRKLQGFQEGLAKKYQGIIDDPNWAPFRRLAITHELIRRGYRTADQQAEVYRSISDIATPERFSVAEREAIATRYVDLEHAVMEGNRNIVDYGDMSPTEKRVIRRAVLFYPWVKGATKYAGRFLIKHPVQAAVMGQMGKEAQETIRETLGAVPSYLEGVIPMPDVFDKVPLIGDILGPSSRNIPGVGKVPRIINPAAMTPLGTGGEILNMARAITTGQVRQVDRPGGLLTPALSAATSAVLRTDPFFGGTIPEDMNALDIFLREFGQSNLPGGILAHLTSQLTGQTPEELGIPGASVLFPEQKSQKLESGELDPTETLLPTTRSEEVGRWAFGGIYPSSINPPVARERAKAEAYAMMSDVEQASQKWKDKIQLNTESLRSAGFLDQREQMPKPLRDALRLKMRRDVNYAEYAEQVGKDEVDLDDLDKARADLDLAVRMGILRRQTADNWLMMYARAGDLDGLRRMLADNYFGEKTLSIYSEYFRDLLPNAELDFALR